MHAWAEAAPVGPGETCAHGSHFHARAPTARCARAACSGTAPCQVQVACKLCLSAQRRAAAGNAGCQSASNSNVSWRGRPRCDNMRPLAGSDRLPPGRGRASQRAGESARRGVRAQAESVVRAPTSAVTL